MKPPLVHALSPEAARKIRRAVAAMPYAGDLCLSHPVGCWGAQLTVDDLVDFLDQYGETIRGVSKDLDAAEAELAQHERDIAGLRRLLGTLEGTE